MKLTMWYCIKSHGNYLVLPPWKVVNAGPTSVQISESVRLDYSVFRQPFMFKPQLTTKKLWSILQVPYLDRWGCIGETSGVKICLWHYGKCVWGCMWEWPESCTRWGHISVQYHPYGYMFSLRDKTKVPISEKCLKLPVWQTCETHFRRKKSSHGEGVPYGDRCLVGTFCNHRQCTELV